MNCLAEEDGDPQEVAYDTVEEQLEEFLKRFNAIQEEAGSFGIHSTVILHTYDPMSKYTFTRWSGIGDVWARIGHLRAILNRLEHET